MELKNLTIRQFVLFAAGFLAIAFAIALLQNFIRYGSYEGYRPWRAMIYLSISLFAILPAVPFLIRRLSRLHQSVPRHFLWVATASGVGIIIAIFFCVGILLYLLGFYEAPISQSLVRNYFGRELIWHIFVMIGVVYFARSTGVAKSRRMITGTLGRKEMSVPLQSINWIEADDHYVRLHGSDFTLLRRATLVETEKHLQPDFIRIHRKYLVNQKVIYGYEKENRNRYVILESGEKLRVGRSYLNFLSDLPLQFEP